MGHTFAISFAAILLAVISTLCEKRMIATLYKQVEELCAQIDSLFESGAGEEYLERLVIASETSATQSTQLKDALVSELKEVLSKLTDQQISAQIKSSKDLSDNVGKAITDCLNIPMQEIAKAVNGVQQNQGDAVNNMLVNVLTAFQEKMEATFGGQMRGMSELLQKTSQSMQDVVLQFNQLAANMDTAGTGAVDAMGERLNKALEAMEARQQVMNTHMNEFVTSIRMMVTESQSESARKLQETLDEVGKQVTGVVAELNRQAQTSSLLHNQRQERFEQSTGAIVDTLSEKMEKLLEQSVETSKSMR